MIKAILFDLDQTILDRNSSLNLFLNWQVNFLRLVPQNKKEIFIQRFITLDNNGSVWKDLVYDQLIHEFSLFNYSTEQLLEQYIQDFNKFSVAFPKAVATIKTLYHQGFRLGLVSNGRSPFQEHNFYALGLAEYFSSIIVSAAIDLRKPDPLIFKHACQQLNLLPHECIFIGDNPLVDIQGAMQAQMKTIFFNTDPNSHCADADQTIHDYDHLIEAIQNIANTL